MGVESTISPFFLASTIPPQLREKEALMCQNALLVYVILNLIDLMFMSTKALSERFHFSTLCRNDFPMGGGAGLNNPPSIIRNFWLWVKSFMKEFLTFDQDLVTPVVIQRDKI